MPDTVFQKTEAGRLELQRRSRTLDPASRALLILCNGRNSLHALRAQLGERVDDLLQGLQERGFVEAPLPAAIDLVVPDLLLPAVTAAPADLPPEPPPPQTRLGPASELPASLTELQAAKQRALREMQRLFGPGGGHHTQALLQAQDDDDFERALRRLYDSVSVYQGRKGADALVQRIRYGS